MTAVTNGHLVTKDEHVVELEQQLTSVRTELANFRALVRNVAINRAIEHEWCSVIDDILYELDLEPRRRQFDVEVKVTYAAWIQVTAASEGNAIDQVNAMSQVDQLQVFSPFDGVPLTETTVFRRDVRVEVSSAEAVDE
jgi:hypothetical protein